MLSPQTTYPGPTEPRPQSQTPSKSQTKSQVGYRIPLSQPSITSLEIGYVTEAVKSGWVSSKGPYIDRFEQLFAKYCGTKYALTTSSGTTALHLALVSYGVKAGDEVIVPDITFIATANAVSYTGARPVLVDVDRETLCIDVDKVAQAITKKTKAIIAVHLYGHPANIPALKAIAQSRNIPIIEDAAEAHGATIGNTKTGALGDCGVFSFYGNKMVTCGEGGMITTDNDELYQRALSLRAQAMSPTQRYWHIEVGFNYRMTNLQAALGFAQMKRIDEFIEKKRTIFSWYRQALSDRLSADSSKIKLNRTAPWADSVFWQVCMEVEGWNARSRDLFMRALDRQGIESRPYFYPISDMPMYASNAPQKTTIAHHASRQGLNLPSYFDMTEKEVRIVCQTIKDCLTRSQP